jgi:maltooligosyltrehalose trehalohydrolase
MTARPSYRTIWGATMSPSGSTRFALWAPAQSTLRVHMAVGETPLRQAGNGWFEAEIDGLSPGTAYSFVLGDGTSVPDPAARAQCGDVHGASRLVDPAGYRWKLRDWRGRPWQEAVIYELHVGTFTPEGTFAAATAKLDHLAGLGVTAIELMPVAQFSGDRGWGYDGVLPYAPHPVYGTPDELKALVDAAHARELMVFLDVVYNHFGPDGNYLHLYAPQFFDSARTTPWGAAIAYQIPAVRRYFIDNAMYWLQEYRLDGLRLDAIDQIIDPSEPDVLEEIALTVREHIHDREIHLITEDNRNITRLHGRDSQNRARLYTAEWNDDFHNVVHVIATGEDEGYYRDFVDDREQRLARALCEGYVYQGEGSIYLDGAPRGEPCTSLPPLAFIDFLQNHDQIGNRALGERLVTLAPESLRRVLTVIALLNPAIPMLFMGEEWAERRPFLFFTDFHGDLAEQVREGRRREFRAWSAFASRDAQSRIPDPNDPWTFASSRIDWDKPKSRTGQSEMAFLCRLLDIRSRFIAPRLARMRGGQASIREARDGIVAVSWTLEDGALLHLDANLASAPRNAPTAPTGSVLFSFPDQAPTSSRVDQLPGPAVIVRLDDSRSKTP